VVDPPAEASCDGRTTVVRTVDELDAWLADPVTTALRTPPMEVER